MGYETCVGCDAPIKPGTKECGCGTKVPEAAKIEMPWCLGTRCVMPAKWQVGVSQRACDWHWMTNGWPIEQVNFKLFVEEFLPRFKNHPDWQGDPQELWSKTGGERHES